MCSGERARGLQCACGEVVLGLGGLATGIGAQGVEVPLGGEEWG